MPSSLTIYHAKPASRRAVAMGPDGRLVAKKRPPRTTPKKWLSDNRSLASADSSADTPTSVNIGAASVVSHDLSDLSGSYLNGTNVGRASALDRTTSYLSDQSATSYQRPWRLAKILSSREPSHPQPPEDCNDSVGFFRERLLFGPQGLVEIVPRDGDSTDTGTSSNNCDSQPVVILLMDPGRKVYELMQIWINMESDSVRDVLHAVQLGLSNRWRQDYDGLFQTRNNSFSQLINILNVSKYDVQPMELWVAKPWAMPSKATINYASRCVMHLRNQQIVSQVSLHEPEPGTFKPSRKSDETILVLSKEARKRSYVPGGILKHYHAHQFLTFSPPFEPAVRVDVLSAETTDDVSSQLSDSQVGISFSSILPDDPDDPFTAVVVTPHDSSGTGHEVVSMRLSNNPATKPKNPVTKPKKQSPARIKSSLESKFPQKTSTSPKRSSNSKPPLKHAPSIPESPVRMKRVAKLFHALDCRKQTAGRSSTYYKDPFSTESTMNSTKMSSSRVWEDEISMPSQVSDSRPLLWQHGQRRHVKSKQIAPGSRRQRSDWL